MISCFWRPEVQNQYHWLKNQSLGQAMLLLEALASSGFRRLFSWLVASSFQSLPPWLHCLPHFCICVCVCVCVCMCFFWSCPQSRWDTSSPTGIEPGPPAVDSYHWSTREVPLLSYELSNFRLPLSYKDTQDCIYGLFLIIFSSQNPKFTSTKTLFPYKVVQFPGIGMRHTWDANSKRW